MSNKVYLTAISFPFSLLYFYFFFFLCFYLFQLFREIPIIIIKWWNVLVVNYLLYFMQCRKRTNIFFFFLILDTKLYQIFEFLLRFEKIKLYAFFVYVNLKKYLKKKKIICNPCSHFSNVSLHCHRIEASRLL